ncbi:MAG: 1-acyl-sn-glycerol-3-phosphate acyltransferase [Prochloraceae cyanobacterium]|nr:1-acyl-sn-glycerol-3-phosphate acyltransferase [Prochloraceae cyanobacterium]
MKEKNTISSRVSFWLSTILYPLFCYLLLPLYFGRIEVSGRENIPKTDPLILAPTHRSYWDGFILAYAAGRLTSGRDLHFMVTIDEYSKPIQGWFIKRLGGFPVDPKRPSISSMRHSIELLLANKMQVIFPEGAPGAQGEVFRDNKIHPLKRGVASIALEAESQKPGMEVKILPISLKYSDPYPSWGTKVRVKIGSPLNVAKYSSDSLRKSSKKLTADLETALKDIYEEKESEDSVLFPSTLKIN